MAEEFRNRTSLGSHASFCKANPTADVSGEDYPYTPPRYVRTEPRRFSCSNGLPGATRRLSSLTAPPLGDKSISVWLPEEKHDSIGTWSLTRRTSVSSTPQRSSRPPTSMTIRVLAVIFGELATPYRERWEQMSLHITADQGFHAYGPPETSLIFDVIVMCANPLACDARTSLATPFAAFAVPALTYAKRVRQAPPALTMYNGRRWSSIPILVVVSRHNVETIRTLAQIIKLSGNDFELVEASESSNYGGNVIRRRAIEYRFAILSELDEMGFVIRVERGRFMVGPAFAPQAELVGKYYYGPGDRRPRGFTTVHKDHFAVRVEIEEFEALLNRPGLREIDLQRFFETHPHFLSEAHRLRPKVKLQNTDGSILIPDIVLQPLFCPSADSNWKLLELKLPSAPLLVGKGARKRLSCRVLNAIAQLREYERHLEDSAHAENVRARLGYHVRQPQLGVLIGRSDNHGQALSAVRSEAPTVQIITYDEILERQQIQLEIQRNEE
jgi:hypothetical protein